MAKLTPTDRYNVVREYEFGADANTIAERYGISYNYVYILVQRYAAEGKITRTLSTVPDDSKRRYRYLKRARKTADTRHKTDITEPYIPRFGKPRKDPVDTSHLPDNAAAYQDYKTARRGFKIPPAFEEYYIDLLKQGLSINDAKDKVYRKMGVKIPK